MERKVGDIFKCRGKICEVINGSGCEDCDFLTENNSLFSCGEIVDIRGYCASNNRVNKDQVCFKIIDEVAKKSESDINSILDNMSDYDLNCLVLKIGKLLVKRYENNNIR